MKKENKIQHEKTLKIQMYKKEEERMTCEGQSFLLYHKKQKVDAARKYILHL